MDFYKIKDRMNKTGGIEVYPDFIVTRSTDLMVRGKQFYAIWDDAKGMWSRDEYDVQRLVDEDIAKYAEDIKSRTGAKVIPLFMRSYATKSWKTFRDYLAHLSDSAHDLDENLTFANTKVGKFDYVSKRLPYSLQSGDYQSYDELISTLYDPPERDKLEWALGSVIAGDSKYIQKFVVLYGPAGAGKSTVLNIAQKLFDGYYTTFEAKALTGSNNAFATEVFKSGPLVAIQHDGDLSRIEDNTKLNSIVSHEEMTMNEKYKPSYSSRINAFLFMGTNKPVKITDAKSGIIRRLIDIKPSGRKVSPRRYQALMSQIEFELGAIANHCLEVYRSMGPDYYDGYLPIEMMLQTDVFFNFIEANYNLFVKQDGTTLNQAYALYQKYCEDSNIEHKLARYKFREELRNYFRDFQDRATIDGERVHSWYGGFISEKFDSVAKKQQPAFSLVIDNPESKLDAILADCPAQYAIDAGVKGWIPTKPWSECATTLKDIDTSKIHYVKPPENHIVIDFDIKDENGAKSAEANLEAASKWPPTYAEWSKSGTGIHLHYIYNGPVDELSSLYAPSIEIKVFRGNSSLRRMFRASNGMSVSTITGGLPTKEKKLINADAVKSEKSLRDLIARNLRKEIHPGTKPSIDFIHKILEDAYESGLHYDVSDMRQAIILFASNSTNQAQYCLRMVNTMKFHSEESTDDPPDEDAPIVFYDVESYPNLFCVSWKKRGVPGVVKMLEPTAAEIENLVKMRLVGFNNRMYDNHILYARMMGYTTPQLFELSQKIIGGSRNAMFREAYGLSYADVYDFSSKKQSLKKFEVELGLTHMEIDIPWDQPVPPELVDKVLEYNANDVEATEAVFENRIADFKAREILAALSGLPVNESTKAHTAKIIFGNDKHHKDKFEYTDLSEMFPGYKFDHGVSTYRGEEVGEGGLVRGKPGIYKNVALLDVESMHPTSIEQLNLFGEHTKNFSAIKAARLAIKHEDLEEARKMLDGKLAPFLTSEEEAEALSYALKIIINSVYGLTSAKFDNAFRDPRNIDNIVAKRGALFMIDLMHFVEERGFTVAHIKTDSIKIPDATPEIIDEVMEFGHNYGYIFEHEATYERMCLVNDAVYIAYVAAGRKPAHWTATGAQFQHPYIFKSLFTHEPIEFDDLRETKEVKKGALYIDTSVDLPPWTSDTDKSKPKFVGRIGSFVPVVSGVGGGALVRIIDDRVLSASGAKDYLWMEADVVKALGLEDKIDQSYYDNLEYKAREAINQFGSFQEFATIEETK